MILSFKPIPVSYSFSKKQNEQTVATAYINENLCRLFSIPDQLQSWASTTPLRWLWLLLNNNDHICCLPIPMMTVYHAISTSFMGFNSLILTTMSVTE